MTDSRTHTAANTATTAAIKTGSWGYKKLRNGFIRTARVAKYVAKDIREGVADAIEDSDVDFSRPVDSRVTPRRGRPPKK